MSTKKEKIVKSQLIWKEEEFIQFIRREKKSCVMSKSRALILAICVSFLIFSHLHLSFVNLNNQGMRVIMW